MPGTRVRRLAAASNAGFWLSFPEVVFPPHMIHFLQIANEIGPDSEKLAARLQANSIIPWEMGPIAFSSPEFPEKLVFQTTTPLYGIYLWNTPGAANGSFEPIFPLRELTAGEKNRVPAGIPAAPAK